MAKQHTEIAYQGALHRTIPSARDTISVSASSATASLAKYAGKWIWIKALTLDVTVLRKNQAVTVGSGLVLRTTDSHQEFFVDGSDDLTLSHRANGSASIEILYDD